MKAEDPVARAIAAYFRRHIAEEADHDTWALEDLDASGFDAATVLALTPPPEVASLAGAQYYWIRHHHPVMLLGYIALLESYPPTCAVVDRIRADSGVPEAAFRTLRMHGRLDPAHSKELDAVLDRLPLTRQHIGMLGLSIIHASGALAASVDALAPIAWPRRTGSRATDTPR